MNKPTYPRRIDHGDIEYIDYEISHELPAFDLPIRLANEHSIVVRFSYDIEDKKAYGLVTYECNGHSQELGDIKLTNAQFYRITNHPVCSEDKLANLRNVKGNITIENGVAILPDGTQITL